MTEEMRKSEFADFLGVSRAYISQLTKADRLVLSSDGDRIRVRESLERIAKTGSADKSAVAARHALERLAKGGSAAPVAETVRAAVGLDAPPSAQSVSSPAAGLPDPARLLLSDPMAAYNVARAQNEQKRGEQMDIELAKSRRELISQDGTVKAVTDLASATRSAFERMPDRIATVLAAETDPHAVYTMLQDEIDNICATLSKQAGELLDKI
ncbi:hypothetical protein NH8B_0976 [Pseudogulbenkiania sp. NH8B]|uniref:hypothetical protein n=1 Tax=Pseudogulbenkiania sp. (strain NH8B) TaxID=748280 RepID=UPI0002279A8E|nr:hypothetical protein [Pseudogulbenkiania sp. NH8B]BAK75808.1 hypothetical protein NH8B_0976 [Pseudogulbenkiania sp. NH8B]